MPKGYQGDAHSSYNQSKRGRDHDSQSERAKAPRPNTRGPGGTSKGKPSDNSGGHIPSEAPAGQVTFSFKTVHAYQSIENKPLVPAVDSEESLYFLECIVHVLDIYLRDCTSAGLRAHPVLVELHATLDTVEYPRDMQNHLECLWINCGQLSEQSVYAGMCDGRDPNIHDLYGNPQTSFDYQPDTQYETFSCESGTKTSGGWAKRDLYCQLPRDEVRAAPDAFRWLRVAQQEQPHCLVPRITALALPTRGLTAAPCSTRRVVAPPSPRIPLAPSLVRLAVLPTRRDTHALPVEPILVRRGHLVS